MLMHCYVFLLCLSGFIALSLAMPKHSGHLLDKVFSTFFCRMLQGIGWGGLAISMGIAIQNWQIGIGLVTWFAWLTISGITWVLYLTYWPWFSNSNFHNLPSKKRNKKWSEETLASRPFFSFFNFSSLVGKGLAGVILVIPFSGFGWQLLATPDKPLLRDDALHSQVGPWPFSLAEKEQQAPEVVALGVPLKAFVIQFCESCDKDIRMAYLKVREPRSLRVLGNGFGGRGREKTSIIPLPRAATVDDGLWLTVGGNDGAIYQQRFDIQRLSPAMADFIRKGL